LIAYIYIGRNPMLMACDAVFPLSDSITIRLACQVPLTTVEAPEQIGHGPRAARVFTVQ